MVLWCSAWLHLNVSLFSSFKGLTWPPLSGTLRDRWERLESCSELSLTHILTPLGINHLFLHTSHTQWNNTVIPFYTVVSHIFFLSLYVLFVNLPWIDASFLYLDSDEVSYCCVCPLIVAVCQLPGKEEDKTTQKWAYLYLYIIRLGTNRAWIWYYSIHSCRLSKVPMLTPVYLLELNHGAMAAG